MWQNPLFPVDLVTFIKEILNRKLPFWCSVFCCKTAWNSQEECAK